MEAYRALARRVYVAVPKAALSLVPVAQRPLYVSHPPSLEEEPNGYSVLAVTRNLQSEASELEQAFTVSVRFVAYFCLTYDTLPSFSLR